jgi:hypothetical protein
MSTNLMSLTRRAVLQLPAVIAAASCWPSMAQQAAPTVRMRGRIESITPTGMVFVADKGERISFALAPDLAVNEVYPLSISDIKPDSFVGVGAMPQPDGTQKAIAVLVFPESMRGRGEGHRPFDFLPQSTMTNATVEGIASADGRRLQLKYPGGEKTIVIPPEAPVFSMRPGTRELLTPGATVSVFAQEVAGKPTVLRVNAGKNGFAPPY